MRAARVTEPVPAKTTPMLKTFSLSVAFFVTLGLLFAAYASVPV
ncbi:hypothetical protein [Devosia sp.]